MMHAVLFVSSLLCAAASKPAQVDDTHLQCGLYCLYVGMQALEVDAKLGDVEARLGPPQAGGYSLADLKRVAEAHGLKALAVHTSAENLALRNERFACIAHVNGHRFITLTGVDLEQGIVTYIDPPRPLQHVPLAVFQSQWGGDALLISRDTLESEESVAACRPWLQISRQHVLGWGVLGLLAISAFYLCARFLRKRLAGETAAIGLIILLACGGCNWQATKTDNSDIVLAANSGVGRSVP